MWRPCLALLLAASASALRGRGVVDADHHEKWRKALKTGRDIVDSKGPHHEKWRKALKVPLGHGHKHKDKEEHEHKEPSRDEHKHEHEHKGRPTEAPQTCNPANATEPAAEIQGAKRSATCGPFPGQQVVLVTVSEDFMPFFKNWLHYARPFLTSSEQVVAFAEDEDVVPLLRRFLHEANGTRFKIAVPANRAQTAWNVTMARDRSYSQDVYEIRVQDVHPFGSKGYKKVVSQRPRQIRHFLEQGCSVLYADIDTAWLKNPFHEISRAGNFEMYTNLGGWIQQVPPLQASEREGLKLKVFTHADHRNCLDMILNLSPSPIKPCAWQVWSINRECATEPWQAAVSVDARLS